MWWAVEKCPSLSLSMIERVSPLRSACQHLIRPMQTEAVYDPVPFTWLVINCQTGPRRLTFPRLGIIWSLDGSLSRDRNLGEAKMDPPSAALCWCAGSTSLGMTPCKHPYSEKIAEPHHINHTHSMCLHVGLSLVTVSPFTHVGRVWGDSWVCDWV